MFIVNQLRVGQAPLGAASLGRRAARSSTPLLVKLRILLLLLGLWTVDCGLWTASAQPTNGPARPDYSAFRVIRVSGRHELRPNSLRIF